MDEEYEDPLKWLIEGFEKVQEYSVLLSYLSENYIYLVYL